MPLELLNSLRTFISMKCEHPLLILPKDAEFAKSHRDKELPRRYRDIYPVSRGYIEASA